MVEWDLIEGAVPLALGGLESGSVQLIFTSPPYATQRKATYGGIPANDYVEWWRDVSLELYRVLEDSGTLLVNIKEHVHRGERHTYVLDLIQAMRSQGWIWTEEFIWHKKNTTPGKWPNRFRDSWERILQFNKNRKFLMYQDNVRVPVGDWTQGESVGQVMSGTGSGYTKNTGVWKDRKMVFPSNVLHLPTETRNLGHPAAFPVALPDFFVKLFTKEGDLVLDPFCGSGTTGVAAGNNLRDFLGVDISPKYLEIARKRMRIAIPEFCEMFMGPDKRGNGSPPHSS